MRSWTTAIVVVAVVLLLGAGLSLFVGRLSVPAPTPTARPLPPATPTPAAPGGTAIAALLEITFPEGWHFIVGDWPPGAGTHTPLGTPQVMAWREGATFAAAPLRLSILALPWNQLPLAQYVADLEQQLSNSPGVGEIATTIATDLRQDGLPAGKVTYTLATDAGSVQGAQIVMIDPPAQNLIVVSLVSPAAAGNLEVLLRELVQTLRLKE